MRLTHLIKLFKNAPNLPADFSSIMPRAFLMYRQYRCYRDTYSMSKGEKRSVLEALKGYFHPGLVEHFLNIFRVGTRYFILLQLKKKVKFNFSRTII